MQMILFHCTNNECKADFAVDTDTALFAEIHCPGCGGEDLDELSQMEMDAPMVTSELRAEVDKTRYDALEKLYDAARVYLTDWSRGKSGLLIRPSQPVVDGSEGALFDAIVEVKRTEAKTDA